MARASRGSTMPIASSIVYRKTQRRPVKLSAASAGAGIGPTARRLRTSSSENDAQGKTAVTGLNRMLRKRCTSGAVRKVLSQCTP